MSWLECSNSSQQWPGSLPQCTFLATRPPHPALLRLFTHFFLHSAICHASSRRPVSLSSGPLFPSSLSSPSIHPAHRSRPHPLFLRWSIVLIHLEATVTVVSTFCCWARSLVHSPLPDRAIEPGVCSSPARIGTTTLITCTYVSATFLHARSRLAQIVRVFKGKLGAYCKSRLRLPHAEPGLLALVETFEPRASTTFDRSTSWASFTRCWARLPF